MIMQSLTVKFHYVMCLHDYLLVCEISSVKTLSLMFICIKKLLKIFNDMVRYDQI